MRIVLIVLVSTMAVLTSCRAPIAEDLHLGWAPEDIRTVSYSIAESYMDATGSGTETRRYVVDFAFSPNRIAISRDGVLVGTYPITPSGNLRLNSDNDPVLPLGTVVLLQALPANPQRARRGTTWEHLFPDHAQIPDDRYATQLRLRGELLSSATGTGTIRVVGDARWVANTRFRSIEADSASPLARAVAWSPAVIGEFVFDERIHAFRSGVAWISPVPDPSKPGHSALRQDPLSIRIEISLGP